ncbi:MAG: hypothetical protein KatS3mg032_2206 [Cyclobacteriaceae bacterium]|nr:MAG: hypothetical protein KatS3mg032_2206 [Cyclobacteriaceae bacterium]
MKFIVHLTALLVTLCASGQPLETYYRMAAENNPALRAAYLEAEAAVQQVAQVSALPDPEISVSAFGRMIETRLGPQMAIFSLSQMFPWFGTLKAKNTAAARVAEARYKAYLNMRNEGTIQAFGFLLCAV